MKKIYVEAYGHRRCEWAGDEGFGNPGSISSVSISNDAELRRLWGAYIRRTTVHLGNAENDSKEQSDK